MMDRILRRLFRSATKPSNPDGEMSGEGSLRPHYESRAPSPQTIADIFEDSWKSRLPNVETSGKVEMFGDRRVDWLSKTLPGGLEGKNVCEIGPFEGYQTLGLSQQGVASITSVEANSFNFLKCLCLKEICKFDATFEFGDGLGFLEQTDQTFDLIFASGVLYHLQTPFEFLSAAMAKANHLYLWTHYYDEALIRSNQDVARHFVPNLDREFDGGDHSYKMHARSYLMRDYQDNIPAYWEGGLKDITYWIEKDDLLDHLRRGGFDDIQVHAVTDRKGMPIISLCASRSAISAG